MVMFCCRGRFRSKSWQGVLEEAKELVASGVKELNLIAEDTNQYGMLASPSKHLRLYQYYVATSYICCLCSEYPCVQLRAT